MIQKISQFHFLFFVTILASSSLYANRIPEYETTRLKSTAGTGVASILMHESTVLNPAPISFYNTASIYYQRDNQDSEISQNGAISEDDANTNSFIVTDAKGRLNGSLSYIKQNYRSDKRETIGASVASVIGQKSAFGMSLNRIKDEIAGQAEDSYNIMNFGVTHSLNESFTLGVVLKDPFKGRQNNTRAIAGVQYLYKDFITLMADLGSDYNQNLSDNLLWRAALQIKIFKDFYVRAGTFDDKGYAEKGNGVGISWIQPRLSFDIALKNTDRDYSVELSQQSEEIKEMVFSVGLRF